MNQEPHEDKGPDEGAPTLTEVTEACLERAASVQPEVGAILRHCSEGFASHLRRGGFARRDDYRQSLGLDIAKQILKLFAIFEFLADEALGAEELDSPEWNGGRMGNAALWLSEFPTLIPIIEEMLEMETSEEANPGAERREIVLTELLRRAQFCNGVVKFEP